MTRISFASKALPYLLSIGSDARLPPGYWVFNPLEGQDGVKSILNSFYTTFYNDYNKRHLILGINPGRNGAGVTGIPFTDTKRLEQICGISSQGFQSHELSSVFVYDMIAAYGNAELFYSDFFIHSLFPLALLFEKNGKLLNANFYDSALLFEHLKQEIIAHLHQLFALPVHLDKIFILGKKNALFFNKIKTELNLKSEIIILEHPRYIEQYKQKIKHEYIQLYVQKLRSVK